MNFQPWIVVETLISPFSYALEALSELIPDGPRPGSGSVNDGFADKKLIFVEKKPFFHLLVEPYIAWGTPNLKSVRELIYKRGFVKVSQGCTLQAHTFSTTRYTY